MKKTTVVVLAMMLVLSSVASAGFVDWLFSGFGITGAQTLIGRSSPVQEIVATFSSPIRENSFLRYNTEANLGNDVTISSTYSPTRKTTTIKFSKKILVKDNQRVKLDSGSFTTKVNSGYISFNRGESIVNRITPVTNLAKDTAGVKNLMLNIHTPHNVPMDRPGILENGFTARAHKESASTYSVVYSKSITVSNNAKLLFKNGNLYVKVAPEGLTFTKSPAAFRGTVTEIVEQSDRSGY